MSFILDALKKSEHERQRQTIPGLVESVIARPRQRLPLWAVALAALLAINLLVLMAVLIRGWMSGGANGARVAPTHATLAPANAAATPAGSSAPTEDRQFSPLDNPPGGASPVYAPEVPVTAAASEAPELRQAAVPGGPAAHAIHRRDPLLDNDDYKAEQDETLPTISELNLQGAQALPELHLDVHVFATNSAERFVFINMRKYHEGATLQEGPTLERIRRDGVVLNYQGLRFLLPRQ